MNRVLESQIFKTSIGKNGQKLTLVNIGDGVQMFVALIFIVFCVFEIFYGKKSMDGECIACHILNVPRDFAT